MLLFFLNIWSGGASQTSNPVTVLTWRWHGKLPRRLWAACGKGVSPSLLLSLFHIHTHAHIPRTHINPVYPVLWTQRPLASRPEKTSLEAIGCPILFQAPHSQPHLFNAYIQSWGHEGGMWQGAKRALDLTIISAYGYCDICQTLDWTDKIRNFFLLKRIWFIPRVTLSKM